MATDAAPSTTPTPEIPTDVCRSTIYDEHRLADWLETLPEYDENEVAERLSVQAGRDIEGARRKVDAAVMLNHNSHAIAQARPQLANAITTAVVAVRTARAAQETLVAQYDVEHAEGSGGLLSHFLAEAGRALATAELVNPTRPGGPHNAGRQIGVLTTRLIETLGMSETEAVRAAAVAVAAWQD